MNVATKWLRSALMIFALFTFSGSSLNSPANRLVGIWESEEKNLRIEVIEENGIFAGKTVYLLCSDGATAMCKHCDTKNPNPLLVSRRLIGLRVVEKLFYQGNDTWGDGRIYDPDSGHTYDAVVRLTAPNSLTVRGYWKFRWLGKSVSFQRVDKPVPDMVAQRLNSHF